MSAVSASTLIDFLPDCILTRVDEIERGASRHYPNPISHTLIIEADLTGDENIELYDISGRRQEISILRSIDRVVLELDQLISGMYLVKIDGDTFKVFKE